jgi:uncharacterized protein YkwD
VGLDDSGNRSGAAVPARRRRLAVAVLAAMFGLGLIAPSAWGGARISSLSACPDQYMIWAPGEGTVTHFRDGLLCLINEARKTQHLPALTRSAQLEKVAQDQSNTFARTGNGSHGSSLTDIDKRFAKVGYHAAAYDEAFDVVDPGATPYSFLAHMLDSRSIPCSEIFDPRFRDIGIGSNAIDAADTLALEFGLRAGQHQPSTNTHGATSCPHAIPKAIVGANPPVQPAKPLPAASTDTVTLGLQCQSSVACVFTGTLTLPDAHATSKTAGALTIPAHRTETLTFTFTAAQVSAELAASSPSVSLALTVTAPAQYTTVITGPLKR